MKTHDVKVFGYGEFAKEIVNQVTEAYRSVSVYTLDEASAEEVRKSGSEVHLFDLSDTWDEFKEIVVKETLFICAIDDDASNVFLAISLRDQFPDARIIGIASTHEHAMKLRLAGVHKVISKLQATADILIEVLEKPIVTHVVQDILDEETDLKTLQLSIEKGSSFIGQNLDHIAQDKKDDVIVLAVVDNIMDTHFVFTAKGYRHILEEGDILVIIGYDEALKNFKRSAQ
jgi:Trk K+ transport system NAD-binding subunit